MKPHYAPFDKEDMDSMYELARSREKFAGDDEEFSDGKTEVQFFSDIEKKIDNQDFESMSSSELESLSDMAEEEARASLDDGNPDGYAYYMGLANKLHKLQELKEHSQDLHSNISQNKRRGGDKDMECGPGEHPVRGFRRRDGTMVEAHCAKNPRPHEVRAHEQRERNGRVEEVRSYRAE